jgi:aryl-alcohol dehydrogenase-like predicted oxidoreductase
MKIGLGLAAVGRPERDLPAERSVAAMRTRSHELLDAAWDAGVRYFDVARSYGRAEEFLAAWLAARQDHDDAVVGSKWGYTYVAGWRTDAEVNETKDHAVATFDRQLAETRALLGERLDVYHIHSVAPDSPALTDKVLHARLADLAGQGVTIGLSFSGTGQKSAIREALGIEVDGAPLFRSFQATWNVLEQSAEPALREAHDAGRRVIVKEALANGRLAGRDVSAFAAALQRPWADVVLSGAATVEQFARNLQALEMSTVDAADVEGLAEPPERYWATRSALPWT